MHRAVLIIDDSAENVSWCRQALGQIRDVVYTVIETPSGDEARLVIDSQMPDCTLINWSLPGNGAVAALHRIHSRHPLMPVIMLTGDDGPCDQLEEMRSAGECTFLALGSTPAALHAAIDRTVHEADARKASARIAALSQTVLIIDDNPDDREFCKRALRQADERYRIMQAGSGEASLMLMEEQRPDCVLLDYSLPGMSGLNILRRIHAVDAFLPVIIMTGQGHEEIAVQAIKGGAHNYLVKSTLNGPILHQAVVSAVEHAELERQITEQRHQIYEQKLALAETSRLTIAILDSAPCLILATDETGKVLVFNKELESALGYGAHEVIGRHTPALWAPDSPIVARMRSLAESDAESDGHRSGAVPPARPAPTETVLLRKDGSEVPVSLLVRELRNSEGRVVGFIGLGEDITERKRQLDALKTSEETFRSVMEHAPCGMALIEPGGRLLKVNGALSRMLGRDQAALCRTTLQTLMHPEDVEADSPQMQELLAGKMHAYSVEKRLLDGDGKPVATQLNLSLVRGSGMKPLYFIAQIQDIRERKEIDRLKSEFISVFSHELRSPLTSISGSLGLLSAEAVVEVSTRAARLLTIARRNCEKLSLLVSEILDIDQLETGHMDFHIRPAALARLIEEAVEVNRVHADRLQVSLALELPPENIVVKVDPARFIQVLSNFINNAAKFSQAGASVRIGARLDGGTVRVSVTDYGPGVPDKFRRFLFRKFSQANTSSTRRAEGSGLGLCISKQLAERMGGRIGVDTAESEGSTFWIELPAALAERETLLAAASTEPASPEAGKLSRTLSLVRP
jgi:PAS domain S-box-containing protein